MLWIRRRVTYVNIVATVALVFVMSGGAFAASKFLVTSTKQISPKVLKALVGKRGPAGPAGATGAAGQSGITGPQGPQGSAGPQGPAGVQGQAGQQGEPGKDGTTGFTKTLPTKETETGAWNIAVPKEAGGGVSAISFNIPLAETLASTQVHYLLPKEAEEHSVAACPGNAEEPTAAAGNLCMYQKFASPALTEPEIFIPGKGPKLFGGEAGAAKVGAGIFFHAETSGGFGWGTWAVTAE